MAWGIIIAWCFIWALGIELIKAYIPQDYQLIGFMLVVFVNLVVGAWTQGVHQWIEAQKRADQQEQQESSAGGHNDKA